MNNSNKLKKWEANTSAIEVVKYLLSLDPKRKYFTKKDGNMRLNTMLHITHMLYCAKFQKKLFKEPLIAVSPNFWKDKQEQKNYQTNEKNWKMQNQPQNKKEMSK